MPEPPSILILHGSDELAISQHAARMCSSLGDPGTAEMNVARFDGRQAVDFEALNGAVNAIPFLASRRVTILDHPGAAFNSPDRRKKLLGLLEKAPPTSTVVLAEYEALRREHWLLKWAAGRLRQGTPAGSGRTEVHVYNQPKRWEMPRWIESEAKKLGGQIDPDAAARLSEMVGDDTRVASQELGKLLTYVNFERPVRLLDVDAAGIASAQGSIFELVDALGQNDGRKALHVLHQLLEEADAFELWGMVIRQFRLLLQTREMLDEGAGTPQIQKTLGLHEYVAGKITGQAGHFSIQKLEVIYHRLLEIDEAAKTGQVPLDLSLDTLIVELMQGR
jgi:DNA polymerase-3 subunit delta